MIDKKRGKYRPSNAVITAADPDKLPFYIHLEEGGTLEIRSEARNYSGIKVVVAPDKGGSSSFSKLASGQLPQPLVIQFPKGSTGNYKVKVTHLKNKDTGKPSPPQEYACSIHPCPMCNPIYI